MEAGGITSMLLEAADLLNQGDNKRSPAKHSNHHSDSSDDFVVPQQSDSSDHDDAPSYPSGKGKLKSKHHHTRKSTKRPYSKPSPSPRGPAQHNEVEKRRRAHLANCYIQLKTELPSIAATKASNVVILRTAFDQIKELEKEHSQLMTEKAVLMAQRNELKARINFALQEGKSDNAAVPTISSPESCDPTEMDYDEDSCVVPDNCSRAVSPADGYDVPISYEYKKGNSNNIQIGLDALMMLASATDSVGRLA